MLAAQVNISVRLAMRNGSENVLADVFERFVLTRRRQEVQHRNRSVPVLTPISIGFLAQVEGTHAKIGLAGLILFLNPPSTSPIIASDLPLVLIQRTAIPMKSEKTLLHKISREEDVNRSSSGPIPPSSYQRL